MGTIPTRAPEDLEAELQDYLDEEQLNRSTGVRKLLSEGLVAWRREQALDRVVDGELSPSSAADIAVLARAEAREAVAVMDEAAGRSAAEVEGIDTRGTACLVLSAVKSGQLPPNAARKTIDTMIQSGWYVAPDLYTRIVQKLEILE